MPTVLLMLALASPHLTLPLFDAPPSPPARLLVADAEHYDVIKTKDGAVHTGQILRETQQGYLFKEATGATHVIVFTDIDSIQSTGPAGSGAPTGPTAAPAVPAAGKPSPADTARKAELERDLKASHADLDSWNYTNPIIYAVLGAVQIVLALVIPMSAYSYDLLMAGGLLFLVGGGVIYGLVVAVVRSSIQDDITRDETELHALDLQGARGLLAPGAVPMTVLARF